MATRIQERIYDHQIQYNEYQIHYNESPPTLLIPPRNPEEVYQQAAQVLEEDDNLLQIFEERILTNVDRRNQINNTTRFPYTIHIQLEMSFGNERYGGSGVLVGPHHVLTCAHNAYNATNQMWANRISAYPARNNRSAPFGRGNVTRAYLFSDWTERKDTRFDIALLILDRSIGKFTGWGGVLSADDNTIRNKNIHVTGYPGDMGFTQMYEMRDRIQRIEEEMFHYEIDTNSGQSGSAIWFEKWGMPFIVGIHTLGGNRFNSGVRISSAKFRNLLIHSISRTYQIRENIINFIPHNPLPAITFGRDQWETYFGNVGIEPNLPDNINQILQSPCPFWPDRRVEETHFLVLIPRTLSGRDFTLNSLGELIQRPEIRHRTRYALYPEYVTNELGNLRQESHWILMTRNVIPNSLDRTYDDQLNLVRDFSIRTGIPYEIPTALEATTAILTHYVHTGERMYTETFTRCQETVNNTRWPVAIGAFSNGTLSLEGLAVGCYPGNAQNSIGIGVLRRI